MKLSKMEQEGKEGFLAIFGNRHRFFSIEEWGESAEGLANTCHDLWAKGERSELPVIEQRPEQGTLANKLSAEVEGTSYLPQANQPIPMEEKMLTEVKEHHRARQKRGRPRTQTSERQRKPGRIEVHLHPSGRYYETSYYPEPGKRESRIFSIQEIRRDEASRSACQQRQKWEEALRRKTRA